MITILLILSQNLYSQDSLIAKSIDEITRKKYDLQNKKYWLLTREKIIPEASNCGTEVTVSLINDSIYRIVCTGHNKKANWGKEYYPLNGELAFVYCTNEFYADNVSETDFKNWKGYPTSEFRAFYKSGKLIQEKHDGFKNEPQLKMLRELPAEYQKMLRWVKHKLPGATLN